MTRLTDARLAALADSAGGHPVGAPATRDEERAMAREIVELRARTLKLEAIVDVRGGEWCATNRAEGRGPCGACAWCCSQQRDRAERAEARVGELRFAMRDIILRHDGLHAEDCDAYGTADKDVSDDPFSDTYCECGATAERDRVRALIDGKVGEA